MGYGYDPNGNLLQKTEGSDTWTYEWDAENRLKRVLKNAIEQARFSYDALGRRVEKVAGSVTTTWTLDAQDILREISGTGAVKYIQGPGVDEPVAQEDGGGALSYLHADGLGSIVETTSSAGTVSSSRRYDSFGNLEMGTTNGYAYTGREWDSETGLSYYRARYYDPKIGRFISEDPIQWVGGNNFYAYVGNNPVNNADPYGLFRWPTPPVVPPQVVTGVTGAGAAAAAAAAGVGVVVVTLVNEYEEAQALALINQETAAANSNRECRAKQKPREERCQDCYFDCILHASGHKCRAAYNRCVNSPGVPIIFPGGCIVRD